MGNAVKTRGLGRTKAGVLGLKDKYNMCPEVGGKVPPKGENVKNKRKGEAKSTILD